MEHLRRVSLNLKAHCPLDICHPRPWVLTSTQTIYSHSLGSVAVRSPWFHAVSWLLCGHLSCSEIKTARTMQKAFKRKQWIWVPHRLVFLVWTCKSVRVSLLKFISLAMTFGYASEVLFCAYRHVCKLGNRNDDKQWLVA